MTNAPKFYLRSLVNFASEVDARKATPQLSSLVRLELHTDGSASVAYLTLSPVQHGQHEYTRAA